MLKKKLHKRWKDKVIKDLHDVLFQVMKVHHHLQEEGRIPTKTREAHQELLSAACGTLWHAIYTMGGDWVSEDPKLPTREDLEDN